MVGRDSFIPLSPDSRLWMPGLSLYLRSLSLGHLQVSVLGEPFEPLKLMSSYFQDVAFTCWEPDILKASVRLHRKASGLWDNQIN